MNKKLVNLKENGILIPKVFPVVDYKNQLATLYARGDESIFSDTFTATEDCFIYAKCSTGRVKINDLTLQDLTSEQIHLYLAKKDDVITIISDRYRCYAYIYGIKY